MTIQYRQWKRQEGNKSERSEEKEGGRGTKGEPSTPSQTNDALMGEIEQNGKQNKKKRKQEAGPQPS